MKPFRAGVILILTLPSLPLGCIGAQQPIHPNVSGRLQALKHEVALGVDHQRTVIQQMIDQLFSYGELGFQEVETSRYLTDVLRKNGFDVSTGVAGLPTAWVARWGRGRPVIALGSDLDGIPQASQAPGVACQLPLVEGAPGHGERT